jgi:FlaA1/EpsC-like NDP-sugar epimerase
MLVSLQRNERLFRWYWAGIDAACWLAAVFVATALRLDFDVVATVHVGTLWYAVSLALFHICLGAAIGPYAVGHARGSFEEVVDIGRAVVITTVVGFTVMALLIHPYPVPRTVPLISGGIALGLMFAVRFVVRTWRNRRASLATGQRRVIVFGAGEGGRQLVRTMVRNPSAGFLPVAILDDDPRKARLHVDGVRVRGDRLSLDRVALTSGAETLAIAVPSAEAALIRDLRDRADRAGLKVLVLPPICEIFGGHPKPADLRDVDLNDLLGRRPVSMDTRVISEQIAGKVILVTGAGGSIGSELCRQIIRFGPRKLYLLDRDESGLQATQLSLCGAGLLDTDDIVLADIRDLETLRTVFQTAAPEIVFHAAALKHLPLLETYPLEAWKSNVVGTLNVLTAAAEAGVGTFVNISTDKAANPTCVLGYSKRVAERLTAGFARDHAGRYVSVRFGNVLGSRGSVVHAFTAQIDRGGPVTVTHPGVERYFMLIPEACQLVLEAASIGRDGEVLVLDMGQQMKILDVAKTLIQMSGRTDIDIIYTGLRAGEKLTEELFSTHEVRQTTTHELVSTVEVPGLDATVIRHFTQVSHRSASQWMRSQSIHKTSSTSVSR